MYILYGEQGRGYANGLKHVPSVTQKRDNTLPGTVFLG